MPNKKNLAQMELIKDKLSQSKSGVIIDYSGTNVGDQTELRDVLREAGGEMLVTKNTLIDLAIGKGKLSQSLSGMNALVLSYEDEVGAIKAVFKFHDDTNKLVIKEGWLDDRVLSSQEIESLSKLPGKQELIVTLINRIQSPSYGLVNVIQATTRNLVQVLKAISTKEN